MGTSAYLDDESAETAEKLMEDGEFSSISEVVRYSLKEFERHRRERKLAEKYRQEEPIRQEAIYAQKETLSDLDG